MKIATKILIMVFWSVLILFIIGLLYGCGSKQEPAQTVINFTDNSQLVQVVGDNNNMAATTDVQASQTATPQQTTENKEEDNTLIFLIIAGIILGVGIYWYQKKRLL